MGKSILGDLVSKAVSHAFKHAVRRTSRHVVDIAFDAATDAYLSKKAIDAGLRKEYGPAAGYHFAVATNTPGLGIATSVLSQKNPEHPTPRVYASSYTDRSSYSQKSLSSPPVEYSGLNLPRPVKVKMPE